MPQLFDAPALPSPLSEMARALRGPGPRSSLDQHVAAVVATVQISSLDTHLQLSGLYALSQAVEEVTERDHPLVRPDRSLRLDHGGEGVGLSCRWGRQEGGREGAMRSRVGKAGERRVSLEGWLSGR